MIDKSDKLIQVFPCEYYDNNKETFIKGKLYLMEQSYTFCPLLTYSSPITCKFNTDIQKLKYSQIQQIDTDDDSITITTKKQNQILFKNFYAQKAQILEILHQCNQNQQQQLDDLFEVEEHYDWDKFADNSARLLPELLKLKEGNQYREPTTFMIEGLELWEIFALLYDDQPYKPSQYFKFDIKPFDAQKQYQNIMHFFFEIMGDKDFQCTPWQPSIPQYLRNGQVGNLELYNLNTIPFKKITYTHPTQLPFFGTINPQVNMTQKLLLLNDKEFIVQVTNETKGLPYCDNYRMMSHERVIQKGIKKYQIECTFTIEWKKRIVFISGQVDNAGAIEAKKILEKFYIPFAKSRREEAIQLIKQKETESKRNNQLAEIPQRRMLKAETTKIGQTKFIINSARNLDGINKTQEIEANLQNLEKKISQFAEVIINQENQIKLLESQQQTLIQITRICVAICLLFLFINWFIK